METVFMPFYFAMVSAAATAADSLMDAIGSALTEVVSFFGTVVTALLTTDGALAPLWPLIGISVAFGLVYGGIRLIARFAPGL